jgi:hypothetical protein
MFKFLQLVTVLALFLRQVKLLEGGLKIVKILEA